MLSKMFSFNRGILNYNIRHIGWLPLAYFICLLFTMPIHLLFEYSNATPQRPFVPPESLFDMSYGFLYFLTFVLPILLGIFLFRYMQVKLSSDFIHSLPIRREQLYIQKIITGTVFLVVPYVLIALILLMIGWYIPAPNLLSISSVSEWLAMMILMNLFVFYITVFVGMFTGISVLQGALTYILFIFPAGIIVLFLYNISFAMYGLSLTYHHYESWVPFTVLPRLTYEDVSTTEITVYALIGLAAVISSYFLYQKRHAEAATSAISFSPLKPLFKYGVTLCFMLLGGLYYGYVGSDWNWILFGYFIASVIGYFIAEMIIQKSWRVFHKWKGYIGYIAVVLVIGIAIHFDITGYEKRIPVAESVNQVFFSEQGYLYHYSVTEASYGEEPSSHYYEEPEVIQAIIGLHEQLIRDKNHLMNFTHTYDDQTKRFTFGYHLDNGNTILREYSFPAYAYEKWLEPIIESNEYKRNHNPILNVDTNHIQSISVNNRHIRNHLQLPYLYINEADHIQRIHDALIQDIREETIHDTLNPNYWETDITFNLNNGRVLSLTWNKSYTQFDQWLEENELQSQSRLTSEHIHHAIVIKSDYFPYEIFDTLHSKSDLSLLSIDYFEIDSSDEIDELLHDIHPYAHSSYYVVLFSENKVLEEVFFLNEQEGQKYIN
ncbi:ABC transporter permease [Halalkalibacter sp. APA_J-10(15)]|uniref:ABC transporter permease n=1 Tax=Halalkalibacter sp. APA_J-10(15) TaxID=2933805 RepID=UPI001FF4B5CD|nr:DUF6449 domain-containing protein [Halalkalibacter sp. APA_J-10(15)]MCK0473795.1 ABC transporter permease [Halalkalibacter sp. APA_J-10(15)]